MDNSENYIKMCEKSAEIQDAYAGQCNSWFALKKRNGVYVVLTEQTISQCVLPCTIIWLPRQDQLQEMVEDNDYWEIRRYPVSGRLDNEFPYELIIYSDSVETIRCATMEQLWLAFIMHELYGKRWNGTDWVS